MMVTRRQQRTREVRGPQPSSVAIFARPPNKVPPDHRILERRKKEADAAEVAQRIKEHEKMDVMGMWNKRMDKRIEVNNIRSRVNQMKQANYASLQDRRDRLRDMLQHEEMSYINAMASMEETTIERQAKMRERAKQLKERREKERLAVVEQKLDQQWREQCEELRSHLNKRKQDLVTAERFDQIRVKANIKALQKEEDEMFATLWRADAEAKARKEEQGLERKMMQNKEMVTVLNKQMAALQEKKMEEKKLIEEEAALIEEQKRLREIEEQFAKQEKAVKQRETRQLYDQSLRMKQERMAREHQQQLAFDLAILAKLLEESKNEERQRRERKIELKEEDRRYREYLTEIKAEEEAKEKELERLCDIEVEKTWQQRIAQWIRERQARKTLLKQVLEGRKMQVQERLLENEKEREQAEIDRKNINIQIEEGKRYEREQAERLRQKNANYQSDLLSQIDYNSRMSAAKEREEEKMWESQRNSEMEYQRKMEEVLSTADILRPHPMRQKYASGYSSRNASQATMRDVLNSELM